MRRMRTSITLAKCMVIRGLALAAAIAGAEGCASSNALLRQELATSNTQTVLAFEETVFNKHEVQEGFEHYVGPTYRQHDPRMPDGKEATIKALSHLVLEEYPKSRVIVKRTIAQGNLVAVQLFWDQRPGQTRGVTEVDIYRLVDGRIVEHWGVEEEVPPTSTNRGSML